MKKYFSVTIGFALACGLLFVPAWTLLGIFTGGPMAFRLVLWSFLAAYGLLLRCWAGKRLLSCAFPMVLLLALVFAGLPKSTFFAAAMVVLAWMRSGICFEQTFVRSAVYESGLILGGAALVHVLAPHSAVTWALAVWLFFLVQSLYFVLGPDKEDAWEDPAPRCAFDQARQKAERILSGD